MKKFFLFVAGFLFLESCDLWMSTDIEKYSVEEKKEMIANGTLLYNQQCKGCHGVNGKGKGFKPITLSVCKTCTSVNNLSLVIEDTMPWGNQQRCTNGCARDIALFIMKNFDDRKEKSPPPKEEKLPPTQ